MGIVLNWIVQGVIVAAAAGLGLWLLPAGRARARVRVWWTVVATVIALPLVTWWTGTTPVGVSSAAGVVEPLVVVPHSVWNATSLAAVAWILWFCLQSLRLSLDFRALLRIRRSCRTVSSLVENRLRPSTRARLAKSGAQLMVSEDVRAAAVLGFGPPIIAIQPALLLHLTDAELDQVVVHEWAHVARRDTLGTLLQQLVHVVAGWHPAVWAALGRLRIEREMACDEVVVDATGSAKAYAACLTRVATLAQTSRGSHLAVAMLASPGLTRRVMRLLARQRTPAFESYWMITPAALAVVVAFATGQVSLVGVQLIALRSIEAQVLAVHATPAALSVATTPLAQTRRPAASPAQARVARQTTVAAVIAQDTPAAVDAAVATTTPAPGSAAVSSAPEPAPVSTLFVASGLEPAPPARPDDSPAPAAAAPIAPRITTEAKDAWAAATQAGESIGASSKKGAVATAGFFTRLSKKVATSF